MQQDRTVKMLAITLPIILVAALSRLLPHAPNFTPIIGVAIFSGTIFKSTKIGVFSVVFSMMLSDLGLYAISGLQKMYLFNESTLVVYASLISITIVNNKFLPSSNVKLLMSAVSSAIFFWLTTNFAVWLGSGMYAPDFSGLALCYLNALPYLSSEYQSGYFLLNLVFSTTLTVGLLSVVQSLVTKRPVSLQS